MSETKFTPGPWTTLGRINQPTAEVLHALPDSPWGFVIWAPHQSFVFGQLVAVVCTADRPNAESNANARLIAAAPDLYAALNTMAFHSGAITSEMFAQACAALAKVDG
jgi:hypothetical protein